MWVYTVYCYSTRTILIFYTLYYSRSNPIPAQEEPRPPPWLLSSAGSMKWLCSLIENEKLKNCLRWNRWEEIDNVCVCRWSKLRAGCVLFASIPCGNPSDLKKNIRACSEIYRVHITNDRHLRIHSSNYMATHLLTVSMYELYGTVMVIVIICFRLRLSW